MSERSASDQAVPSRIPPLARQPLDRDAPTRHDDAAWQRILTEDPATRFVLVRDALVAAVVHDASAARVFFATREVLPEGGEPVYLGRITPDAPSATGLPSGTPLVGWLLPSATDSAAAADDPLGGDSVSSSESPLVWLDLRRSVTALDPVESSAIVTALALAAWHRAEPFSPATGTPSEIAAAGWERRVPGTGAQLFPRTDPAVIVLITDADDRVLLGNNALWPRGFFSLFAGFVEAGESAEEAVHREIREETGLEVSHLEYRRSQPWPYPRSLMLGFRARVAEGISPDSAHEDGDEITAMRWFTRTELRDPARDIDLPGPAALANWLIQEWLDEVPGD